MPAPGCCPHIAEDARRLRALVRRRRKRRQRGGRRRAPPHHDDDHLLLSAVLRHLAACVGADEYLLIYCSDVASSDPPIKRLWRKIDPTSDDDDHDDEGEPAAANAPVSRPPTTGTGKNRSSHLNVGRAGPSGVKLFQIGAPSAVIGALVEGVAVNQPAAQNNRGATLVLPLFPSRSGDGFPFAVVSLCRFETLDSMRITPTTTTTTKEAAAASAAAAGGGSPDGQVEIGCRCDDPRVLGYNGLFSEDVARRCVAFAKAAGPRCFAALQKSQGVVTAAAKTGTTTNKQDEGNTSCSGNGHDSNDGIHVNPPPASRATAKAQEVVETSLVARRAKSGADENAGTAKLNLQVFGAASPPQAGGGKKKKKLRRRKKKHRGKGNNTTGEKADGGGTAAPDHEATGAEDTLGALGAHAVRSLLNDVSAAPKSEEWTVGDGWGIRQRDAYSAAVHVRSQLPRKASGPRPVSYAVRRKQQQLDREKRRRESLTSRRRGFMNWIRTGRTTTAAASDNDADTSAGRHGGGDAVDAVGAGAGAVLWPMPPPNVRGIVLQGSEWRGRGRDGAGGARRRTVGVHDGQRRRGQQDKERPGRRQRPEPPNQICPPHRQRRFRGVGAPLLARLPRL